MTQKLRKLDKKRPFAEIYGSHAARYEQFGIQFDAEGVELEGFQDVVVPAEIPVITAETSEPALRDEIARLADELSRVSAELEEKDAEIEEIQGKLDTAQVEITRLTAALPDAAPVKTGKNAKGNTATTDSQLDSLLDAQLTAQGAL
jgi:transposase